MSPSDWPADAAPRPRAVPLLAALAVHGLLVVALVVTMGRPAARAGDSPLAALLSVVRPTGGGGGGEGMRYLVALPPTAAASPAPTEIRPPEPPVVTEPEQPVPDPEPVVPVHPASPASTDSAITATPAPGTGGTGAGGGGGSGGGTGGGAGPGTGPGAGPGIGGGPGVPVAPEPRQMIMPPDFPGSMRGREVAVVFDVGADGRVREVTFEPEIPDRGYARRLAAAMREYRFRPARDAQGREVPGIARVILSF